MNSLTQDDVIEVLKIIDESKYDELHLETGDLKLIVRRKLRKISSREVKSLWLYRFCPANPKLPNQSRNLLLL